MSEKKHVELAVEDFARRSGVPNSAVSVVGVQKERIPNPPSEPGQLGINPVVYRYYIQLEAADRSASYVGERGRIRRI